MPALSSITKGCGPCGAQGGLEVRSLSAGLAPNTHSMTYGKNLWGITPRAVQTKLYLASTWAGEKGPDSASLESL